MSPAAPRGVIFAGGGTGGHIFPAVAVLERLRETQPDLRALFLCSTRDIDARILGALPARHWNDGCHWSASALRGCPVPDRNDADAPPTAYLPIPAAPLAFSLRGLTRFAWKWGGAVRAARAALQQMKADCADLRILATGGFVAAPVAQAARVERIPLILLNQDAPPGKANRWIARRAARVLTTADAGRPDWEPIPPVVRRAALAPADAPTCRQRLGLDPRRPTLFITGASQGSRSVNEFAAAFAAAHDADLSGWQAVHQTGAEDSAPWRRAWEEAHVPAVVEPFFDEMGLCWGAADLAVSRAGAGSVAEAWANRVPTLFLPYPYHRDQHQRFNAEPLERAGGAAIERDLIEPHANLRTAGSRLRALLAEEHTCARMRAALAALGPVDGAERLARVLRSG